MEEFPLFWCEGGEGIHLFAHLTNFGAEYLKEGRFVNPRQTWPEVGTGGWHHFLSVQLFLSLYENRPSQSKDIFLFFTSLHFFFLFLHYLQSHSISLVACPCIFASREILSIFFFSTLLAATTFLVLFLI